MNDGGDETCEGTAAGLHMSVYSEIEKNKSPLSVSPPRHAGRRRPGRARHAQDPGRARGSVGAVRAADAGAEWCVFFCCGGVLCFLSLGTPIPCCAQRSHTHARRRPSRGRSARVRSAGRAGVTLRLTKETTDANAHACPPWRARRPCGPSPPSSHHLPLSLSFPHKHTEMKQAKAHERPPAMLKLARFLPRKLRAKLQGGGGGGGSGGNGVADGGGGGSGGVAGGRYARAPAGDPDKRE